MPNPRGPAFDFTSTDSHGDILIKVCTVFLGLMIVFVLVRVYSVAFFRKRVQWSDGM